MAMQQQSRENRESEYSPSHQKPAKASFENIALILSWLAVVITFPICLFFCYVTVAEYHRAVFFRLGRARKGALGPGLVWFLPCIDSYGLVDLRTRVEVLPTQDMITKDSVSISVDAVLFYCIDGSAHAEIRIANVHESTIFIAQTMLRNIVGSQTLHELLTSREELSRAVGKAAAHATAKWGVKIERVDIKDINLPDSLQRTLASEAEALREARAKLISAEGEAMASQALKEASDVMMQNKITLQLRHLQVLQSIAHERKVTLIYPFPMEFMAPFGPSKSADAKKVDSDTTNFPIASRNSYLASILQQYVVSSEDSASNAGRINSYLEETNKSIYDDYVDDKSKDAFETQHVRMYEPDQQKNLSDERMSPQDSKTQPTEEQPTQEQPTQEQPTQEPTTEEQATKERPTRNPPNPDGAQSQPAGPNNDNDRRSAESQTDKRKRN